MPKKIDGVIEAVRYKINGKIDLVRVYERRGPTFSDRVLLDRNSLLERLKEDKYFVTGQRRAFMGSTFDIDKEVKWVSQDGKEVVTTRTNSKQHDELEGTPAF